LDHAPAASSTALQAAQNRDRDGRADRVGSAARGATKGLFKDSMTERRDNRRAEKG